MPHTPNHSDVSQQDLDFCTDFLIRVVTEGPEAIGSLSTQDIQRLPILMAAIDDPKLKQVVFSSLTTDQQDWLLDRLSGQDIIHLFPILTEADITSRFSRLSSRDQATLLSFLFKQNKPLYQRLNAVKKESIEFEGSVQVHRIESPQMDIEIRLSQLMKTIFDANQPISAIMPLSKVIQSELSKDECEQFLNTLTTRFLRRNVPLSSQDKFLIYLKFFTFMDPFIDLVDISVELIKPILDRVIMVLLNIGDLNWVIKIINQLPKNSVIILIQLLEGHSQLKSLEKRTGYAKLLNSLISSVTVKNAPNVAYVLGLLGLKEFKGDR